MKKNSSNDDSINPFRYGFQILDFHVHRFGRYLSRYTNNNLRVETKIRVVNFYSWCVDLHIQVVQSIENILFGEDLVHLPPMEHKITPWWYTDISLVPTLKIRCCYCNYEIAIFVFLSSF